MVAVSGRSDDFHSVEFCRGQHDVLGTRRLLWVVMPVWRLSRTSQRVRTAARTRQFDLPWPLHERLWIIKHLVFRYFALSLNSMELAFTAAEVEPFKTAVALRFQRSAPFIIFAVVILASGLFVGEFSVDISVRSAPPLPCRRASECLSGSRRPQCGRECRQCAVRRPVGAIYPGARSARTNASTLNCQSLYHDVRRLPGLKAREGRRLARAALIMGENR